MRLVVGAGSTEYRGWHSYQQRQLDLTKPDQWARRFRPGSVDAILAEHVFEHLTPLQAFIAARICYHYLKPGGYLRIAVPDGFHPDRRYIEWVRPGGIWNPHDHKILFNYWTLTSLLTKVGFGVRLIEFWDEKGRLIANTWNPEQGNIRRSYHNVYSMILSLIIGARYTSLIVDAIKPK
jgi:predicted SAM-dependent methyltransferase